MGDVHLAWENEAQLEVQEARGALEVVYPSISILAEPHVDVVDICDSFTTTGRTS